MLETNRTNELFELISSSPIEGLISSPFGNGKMLIGRANNCHIIIPSKSISAVHAVIEIVQGKIKIYDLNSTNGVYVNGQKQLVAEIKVGDQIKLAQYTFSFKKYDPKDLPPVLESLSPLLAKEDLPKKIINLKRNNQKIVHPLAMDGRAEQSEYIFEDAEDIYPIFHYEAVKQSVEVLITYYDKVFSIDYLPELNGTYHLVGQAINFFDVEFPYLGKNERIPLVEINASKINLFPFMGSQVSGLNGVVGSDVRSLDLKEDDFYKMSLKNLEIYVRRVSSPPEVDPAPFFKRDRSFKLALLFAFLAVSTVSVVLWAVRDPELVEEKKLEKAPERLAKILYRPPTPKVEPVVEKEVVEQKKVVEKKVEVKKIEKTESNKNTKNNAPDQVVKKVEKVGSPNKTQASVPDKVVAKAEPTPAANTGASNPDFKGKVDVYKSDDFKSSLNQLMAKGGGTFKDVSKNQASVGDVSAVSMVGGSPSKIKAAEVTGDVGSLTGLASGKVDFSKGASGLSDKKSFYSSSVSTETVVLGSIDPREIRRILNENRSQFGYCYQSELEKNSSLQGSVMLRFTIGNSGNVTHAGVESNSLPTNVRGCIANVLKGIQFPKPLGGGTVDVSQGMNFAPRGI